MNDGVLIFYTPKNIKIFLTPLFGKLLKSMPLSHEFDEVSIKRITILGQ